MRVWKQWTDEHRTSRKTGSGRRKVTSARDDRHMLSMEVNDRKACSRQLAARLSTATGVLMSASSIRRRLLHRGLRARVPLYRIPLTTNHRRVCIRLMSTEPGKLIGTKLSFQMNHASICGTMMAAFMLDAMPVHAAFWSERHNGLISGVTVWGAISYHEQSNLLRIEGNLELRVSKIVGDFCSAQHMQLLPWPAYSPDMSSIEHVWDLVGRCLTRDPRPAASIDEILLCIQAIWNSLPQADIQNLFSMPRRIATLIAARGGYTKYLFRAFLL
ncbi:transposable element Tcb2 transposase [Trichonephila clavipes]|nr:transposable element Tcb2 transposase [Trichonephila clavipes]